MRLLEGDAAETHGHIMGGELAATHHHSSSLNEIARPQQIRSEDDEDKRNHQPYAPRL